MIQVCKVFLVNSERAAKVLFNDNVSKRTLNQNNAYISASFENKTLIEKEIKESNRKSFKQFILVFNGLGGK
jgi:hypothetical protein